MLAFVTSLRHPFNSVDYNSVEAMLADAVRSWYNQEDDKWAGVIVGNQPPALDLGGKVEFIEVDFEPPTTRPGPRTGIRAVLRDKGTKLAVGLLRARQLGASHIMFADADDFVSRRIAGVVTQKPNDMGWVITDGWRYNAERAVVRRHRRDFHLQCGTSHIVRTDAFAPFTAPLTVSQADLYAGFGDELERWIGSHMHIHDDLDLRPLPFPGALYRVGTAESHSGNSLGGWSLPVNAFISNEFAVPQAAATGARRIISMLPSRDAINNRFRDILRPRGR